MSKLTFNEQFDQNIISGKEAQELPIIMSVVLLEQTLAVSIPPISIIELVDDKHGATKREYLAVILEEAAAMLRSPEAVDELSKSAEAILEKVIAEVDEKEKGAVA